MTTKQETKQKNPNIKLIVNDQTPGDSVVPIRWCISEQLLNQIAEQKEVKPYLLLVVASRRGKEDYRYEEVLRELIPLGKMMTYIQFTKPGIHRILATVVWGNRQRPHKIIFETDSRGEYRQEVLQDYEGRLTENIDWGLHQEEDTYITLDISKEFFAPEPPQWLNAWVNGFLLKKMKKQVDECAFRRRAILAFTLQPPLVLFWAIFLVLLRIVVVGALWSCLFRRINYAAIFRPFKYDLKNLWDYIDKEGTNIESHSVFFEDSEGNKRSGLTCLGVIIIPITLLTGIVFKILASFGLVDWGLIQILKYTLYYGLGGSVLFIALLTCVVWTIDKISDSKWVKDSAARREKKRLERERLAELERQLALKPLLCDGKCKADINDLPEDRISIYLRYCDLKKKLCRPFAR